MPPVSETEVAEVKRIQRNVGFSPEEDADLVRRAGEVQAATGQETSVQDYIRSQLWPNGQPSAS